MEITCPECNGEKYFDRMTRLTYEGDSSWTQDACETCGGDGWVQHEQSDEWLEIINKANNALLDMDEPELSEHDKDLAKEIDNAITSLYEASRIIERKQIR